MGIETKHFQLGWRVGILLKPLVSFESDKTVKCWTVMYMEPSGEKVIKDSLVAQGFSNLQGPTHIEFF